MNNLEELKKQVQSVGQIKTKTDAKQLLTKPAVKKVVDELNLDDLIKQATKQVMEKHKIVKEHNSFRRTYMTLICEATDGEQLDPQIKQQIINTVNQKLNSQKKKKLLKFGLKGVLLASAILAGCTYLKGCIEQLPEDMKTAHTMHAEQMEKDMKQAHKSMAEKVDQTVKKVGQKVKKEVEKVPEQTKEAHKGMAEKADQAVKNIGKKVSGFFK